MNEEEVRRLQSKADMTGKDQELKNKVQSDLAKRKWAKEEAERYMNEPQQEASNVQHGWGV